MKKSVQKKSNKKFFSSLQVYLQKKLKKLKIFLSFKKNSSLIKKFNLKKIFSFNFNQWVRFLSSLKYAVFNLVILALLTALGTFIESYYDTELAKLLIYNSLWMKLALASLSLNVGFVLVDRWPWKKRHMSFIIAHIGILIMVIGSWLTQIQGVDGSMRLELNKETRFINLPSKVLTVYASSNGIDAREIYKAQPLFLLRPPSEEKPYIVPLGQEKIEVIDFYPYATESFKFKPHPSAGLAIQFLLEGERANHSDWIYQTWKKGFIEKGESFVQKKMGRASIVLSDGNYTFQEPNELILEYKNDQVLFYKLRSKGKFIRAGELRIGDSIKTEWMDLKFRVLNFYKAEAVSEFKKEPSETEQTRSALKVRYNGLEKWLRSNTPYYFYKENFVYIVNYMNQVIPIGSSFLLKEFKMIRYPNSSQAKEYESVIQINGQINGNSRPVTISMNQPLRHKGWSLYQSGFEEDEEGKIKASILAVNKDPGRYLKYFGSFLIVYGYFCSFLHKKKINFKFF